jgi:hypothetical protein
MDIAGLFQSAVTSSQFTARGWLILACARRQAGPPPKRYSPIASHLSLLTLFSSLAIAPTLRARQQDAFAPIQESARTRTGYAVTWEREQQAREHQQKEV